MAEIITPLILGIIIVLVSIVAFAILIINEYLARHDSEARYERKRDRAVKKFNKMKQKYG